MESAFSIADVLTTAWNITKRNFVVILGYSIVAFIAVFSAQFTLAFLVNQQDVLITYIVLVLVLIINSMATLGFYKLTFQLIDNEEEEFTLQSVIPSWRMVLSFISISLLLGFLVATFNLLISNFSDMQTLIMVVKIIAVIALFYLILRSIFFPCFIVDDESSSFQSIRQSFQLTRDNLLRIMSVFMLVIALIVIGILALGIGVIVTFPFTNIVLVVTYRKLVNNYSDESESGEEGNELY